MKTSGNDYEQIRKRLQRANPCSEASPEVDALGATIFVRLEHEIAASESGRKTAQVRGRRHVLRVPALVSLVAIAVVAGVGVLSLGGHGVSLTDRALAAIGGGPVIHVVSRWETGGSLIDLSTGTSSPIEEETEEWFDPAMMRSHVVDRRLDGSLIDDILVQKYGPSISSEGPVEVGPRRAPRIDPAIGNFVDEYRHALSDGEAKGVGEGVVAGRSVRWIEFAAGSGDKEERVAVDATTFKPVRVEFGSGRAYEVVEVESVARDEANFDMPHLRPESGRPSRGDVVASVTVPLDEVRSRFPVSAMWLGLSFEGRRLVRADVQNLQMSYPDHHISPSGGIGLTLYYSTLGAQHPLGGSYVVVQQAARPEMAYRWGGITAPPRGHMLFVPHFGAFLADDGKFFTLTTNDPDEMTLLVEAARSLSTGCCAASR